ncbi:MAG: GH92 family glycosyl hydrolase [Muribaculaceae bacterium]|nr:GH92 family glycosyl hydrolase [Muribaculaceae bacterium]
MKRLFWAFALLGVLIDVMAGEFTRHVNTFIGTGAIEGGLSGNNYPGATVPYGMVQLCPDTHEAPDWYNASGYNYNDNTIYGFSHTRLSGTGASDLIDVLLFPTSTDKTKSTFSHDDESASPGYYSVLLADEGIKAEMSATKRVGIHRYTFPSSTAFLLIDLDHSANKGSWGRRIINSQIRQVGDNALQGYRVITGWAKLRKIYFYMEFSSPIDELLLSDGERKYRDAAVINGTSLKAKLSFNVNGEPLVCKVGLSSVSCNNARENMRVEASHWDFDRYVSDADALWDKQLSKIEVTGDNEQLTTFYTALYHLMIQPNVFSDVNGEYMTADYSVGEVPAGHDQYTTFSLWDTYRAAHPLYTIIEPRLTADFVNSMLRHYDSYGYLPIWHLWGQDNYCMIGNHSIPVIVDALLKGIGGIDIERAYEAVKASSTQSHPNSPFDVWERYGYMPENIQTQSVSISLEFAFDDWCVAQLAKKVGRMDDYERFARRAGFFRNLYNAETHFFQSRNDKGEWIEPFDPLKYGANGGYPFTEGNAWQYYWYVPHDIDALIELTGGVKAFEQKLDTFFTLTESSGVKNDNISGMIGQYAHGNEPSHHVAYLYNYVGQQRKSQDVINHIMTTLYNNTSSGYAGNDDCGEMSAWYVFSAMGFYPVNPASGVYDIGVPLFENCRIHLDNGNVFEIKADRKKAEHRHVGSVKLNGKKLTTPQLTHSDIMKGGCLEFKMTK